MFNHALEFNPKDGVRFGFFIKLFVFIHKHLCFIFPHTAIGWFTYLGTVVFIRQVLPGMGANVFVHANIKNAMLARPTAFKLELIVSHCFDSFSFGG